ncbi:hypothetical protein PY365_31575 [Roseiarcaceae bacterium H3SJ34-1]|uniref:hypothetical protein n=1 Tax=Terripilifer ovatus TaxID=3032367 RepID=UPI003AB91CE2|nr:hypothetical protein [Roseiarcaceae bacterium H3SJ34-1]
MFGANAFATYRLCALLIEKGLLSKSEGSSVMTSAANDVRSGSEDGPSAAIGEGIASRLEVMAGWLHGMNPKL